MVSQSEKILVKRDWKKLIMGITLSIFKVLSLPTSKFDTPKAQGFSPTLFIFWEEKTHYLEAVNFNLIKEIKNATKAAMNDLCTALLIESEWMYFFSV